MIKLRMLISSIIIVIIIIIILYLYNFYIKIDSFDTIKRTVGDVDIFYLNNPTNSQLTPNPITGTYRKKKQEDCLYKNSNQAGASCTYSIVD
jgi:hypothetical protein